MVWVVLKLHSHFNVDGMTGWGISGLYQYEEVYFWTVWLVTFNTTLERGDVWCYTVRRCDVQCHTAPGRTATLWCTHYYNKEQQNYLSFHRNNMIPLLRTNVISGSYTIELTQRPSRMQNSCVMQTTYFHILIQHRQCSVWLLDTVGYALVKDISPHYHPLLNKLLYFSQTRSNEHAWHWGASERNSVRLNKGTSHICHPPPRVSNHVSL